RARPADRRILAPRRLLRWPGGARAAGAAGLAAGLLLRGQGDRRGGRLPRGRALGGRPALCRVPRQRDGHAGRALLLRAARRTVVVHGVSISLLNQGLSPRGDCPTCSISPAAPSWSPGPPRALASPPPSSCRGR